MKFATLLSLYFYTEYLAWNSSNAMETKPISFKEIKLQERLFRLKRNVDKESYIKTSSHTTTLFVDLSPSSTNEVLTKENKPTIEPVFPGETKTDEHAPKNRTKQISLPSIEKTLQLTDGVPDLFAHIPSTLTNINVLPSSVVQSHSSKHSTSLDTMVESSSAKGTLIKEHLTHTIQLPKSSTHKQTSAKDHIPSSVEMLSSIHIKDYFTLDSTLPYVFTSFSYSLSSESTRVTEDAFQQRTSSVSLSFSLSDIRTESQIIFSDINFKTDNSDLTSFSESMRPTAPKAKMSSFTMLHSSKTLPFQLVTPQTSDTRDISKTKVSFLPYHTQVLISQTYTSQLKTHSKLLGLTQGTNFEEISISLPEDTSISYDTGFSTDLSSDSPAGSKKVLTKNTTPLISQPHDEAAASESQTYLVFLTNMLTSSQRITSSFTSSSIEQDITMTWTEKSAISTLSAQSKSLDVTKVLLSPSDRVATISSITQAFSTSTSRLTTDQTETSKIIKKSTIAFPTVTTTHPVTNTQDHMHSSSQLTLSAKFGIAAGCMIGFWLILGPIICLICQFRDRSKKKHKVMIETNENSITEAMIMDELNKKDSNGKKSDNAYLAQDKTELQKLYNGQDSPTMLA